MEVHPLVSLCMIVRDEEELLPSCLNCARPFAEQIIVVDTGSTDRTVEIATGAGAEVYRFQWKDSFADARNEALARVKGTWILWLDADEQLEVLDIESWLAALRDPTLQALAVPVVNYYGKNTVKEEDAYVLSQIRLFRSGHGVRFEGAIHEQLNVREAMPGLTTVPVLPAVIHHYGYMEAIVEVKEKRERNVSLLVAEQNKESYHPWIDYHVANLYYQEQDYSSAIAWVNHSIRRFLEIKEVPPSMLYKLKYETLIAAGMKDEALLGIDKALRMYPDYVDLHYCRGRLLYSKRRLEEALEEFETCLKLGDENPIYLIQRGAGSFLAQKYADRCRQRLGGAPAERWQGGDRA